MVIADANLLLYAYNADDPRHEQAKAWLEASLSSPQLFGLSWLVITAFLRIGTSPRIFAKPLTRQEATRIVSLWLDQPMVRMLIPGERHWAILKQLIDEGQAVGNLVMDAHLAALAIEHGAVLCTTDRDFMRFPGLRIENPLQDAQG
ncbi:MAG TPA: type II toxin-antitoxin system VapC family toxin [Blastocatellia bacterium]|nr:type II toxin-antitoxin system VapC family toxin [Blastocatellia bacterium]